MDWMLLVEWITRGPLTGVAELGLHCSPHYSMDRSFQHLDTPHIFLAMKVEPYYLLAAAPWIQFMRSVGSGVWNYGLLVIFAKDLGCTLALEGACDVAIHKVRC